MTIEGFLSHLRELDVRIQADGDRLRLDAPNGVLTPDLRAELAERKAEILAFLHETATIAKSSSTPIELVSRDEDLPLSFAQQRLWLLDQLETGDTSYNLHQTMRLSGILDVRALRTALGTMVARHEALRTTFAVRDGSPVQRIAPAPPSVPLPIEDRRGLLGSEREAEAQRLAHEEARHPFDLERGPLFRAKLLKLGEEEHLLLLTMHQITTDGWSMGVFWRELGALYKAFSEGKPSPLAELPIQYADYAVWQRERLAGELLDEQLDYWKRQLADVPALELPTDRPRPPVQTHRGASQSLTLPESLTEALKELSRREGTTLFMVLLAAFQVLLSRYSGQEDVAVGTPIAGRNRTETEGLIGFFVNTLVMRTDLSGDPTFRELLGRVREVALGAYEHQDLPFERLVQELNPERDLSRHPLFQVMFQLRKTSEQSLELPGLKTERQEVGRTAAKFDLSLSIAEAPRSLNCRLMYNTDLFKEATISRMGEHFRALLEGIVADPEQRLSALPPFLSSTSPAGERGDEFHRRIAGLTPTKRALLELRLKQQSTGASRERNIPRNIEPGPAPLSFAQERPWFQDQLNPGSLIYNRPAAVRLIGPLNVVALERSLGKILERHEALRTTFPTRQGRPVQLVAPTRPLDLPVVDLSDLPPSEREAQARHLAEQYAQKPFNLTRGPLVRTSLLRLSAQEHILLLTTHHIVSDGWSDGVLFRELVALYEAFSEGKPSPLEELPIQYADYAVWQREWLTGEVLDEQLAYWKRRLEGAATALELPTDRPRPPVQTANGATKTFSLPGALCATLKRLGHWEGATLFMVLLGAFQVLLSRYSGQDDILVGAPTAGRNRLETEEMIGLFANTLLLRTDLSGEPTFREVISRVREVALGAYEHQDLPFERLVQELNPERDLSRHPLFQVMFQLRNVPDKPAQLPSLKIEGFGLDSGVAKVDLSLEIVEEAGSLTCAFEYNTDLFEEATISRMGEHIRTLLESVVADPERRVPELELLTERERHQLLFEWNDTQVEYRDACIHQFFEEQVERTPDAVAVVFEDEQLTYRQLNENANRLASLIAERGIGKGSYVPVLMERSIELVVSLLSIMKSGAAFVPLDPRWPTERLRWILDDLNSEVILLNKETSFQEEALGQPSFLVDIQTTESSIPNPDIEIDPSEPIYMIYTSGSTGKPKGAINVHRGITNRLLWMNEFFGRESAAVALQTTHHAFDSAVWQLFWPLINGGRTIVPSPGMEMTADYLVDLIKEHGVTITDFVPSVFNVLVPQLVIDSEVQHKLRSLRSLIVGGEEITPSTTYAFLEHFPDVRVTNLYGPTEASIGCICHEVRGNENDKIPIGKPIANTHALILDSHMNLVPLGVVGELYITGACLGLGYLNDEEQTKTAFVDNPFAEVRYEKLYKTGDLARYTPSGSIEFLGRSDEQVKLRGFRIELREIETALNSHPAVCQSAVVLREDVPAQKRLAAYVILDGAAPSPSELRAFLRQRLPEHMVPSAFAKMKALPLLPNGKVDRRALPVPEYPLAQSEGKFVAPRDTLEVRVAEIWSEVLGIEGVGAHDNFFELGGHSLLATQVILRLRDSFGVELLLRDLFTAPTVAELAVEITQRQVEETDSEMIEYLLAELEGLSRDEEHR